MSIIHPTLWQRARDYAHLLRLDKPIGILLLLWPTLSALWLAAQGHPSIWQSIIFTLGTVLMRSAGCAINDWADRDFDRHVVRTQSRPLAMGRISTFHVFILITLLVLIAFSLIISLNRLTQQLALIALFIAGSYPFTKRFFAIPQAYLGIAFGFGIPMAFAAVLNTVPLIAWILLLGNIFWAIAYDTAYAMVDREDDIKIGIHTSALTFGRFDIAAILICYLVFFIIMAYVGRHFDLAWPYWLGWLAAFSIASYHAYLLQGRIREKCFQVFQQNNWLGACLFAGIVGAYCY
ncbi:MAG: 4-hydroxybenzoate octaprenyltransferase [Ottowia sp.]|nr:4-hydroxybenzoate octaprenyltransferase [Ottowia sp.]